MNINIEALKQAAQAATPGPWHQATDHQGTPDSRVINSEYEMLAELDGYCDDYRTEIANAAFIAAANPAVALELVARLERAERDAKDWRTLYEQTIDSLMPALDYVQKHGRELEVKAGSSITKWIGDNFAGIMERMKRAERMAVKVADVKYTRSESVGDVYELRWLPAYDNKPKESFSLYIPGAEAP